MTNKIIFTSILALAIQVGTFAQGILKFEFEKHDFGMIDEGIQAAHDFVFTNVGNAPVVLSDVRASCGCTTPSWPREPIQPGAKGVIKASYNSEGRPGTFNKSITITSNASETSKVLYIKGIVEPKKEKVTFTSEQLKMSPKAELDRNLHNFQKVERGQKVSTKFTIKNTGKTPLTISTVQSACNCVTHKLDKEAVPVGKTAILELTYSPNSDGQNIDVVTISTNDLNKSKHSLTLTSELVESLINKSPLSQDKNAVPFGK